jgi:hypothetical protein
VEASVVRIPAGASADSAAAIPAVEARRATGDMDIDKLLAQLCDRLTKAYGGNLVSLMLYGSAAANNHHDQFSDLNILCVLRQITTAELEQSERIFRWWREHDSPPPLLLSEEEVATSTDCFPIEFHDIQARHKLLAGRDIVSSLVIDYSFYRARVEYELRSKMLRLRQKAAAVLSDNDALLRLMADSLSTFATLARHAVILAGGEVKWSKREAFAACKEKFNLDMEPFSTLLDLREGSRKPKQVPARPLLESYLAQVTSLVSAVDRLEK